MDQRADQLHRDSIVIDTCGPPGSMHFTPEMLDRIDQMTSEGAYAGLVIGEIERMTRTAIARDELPEFWDGLAASGVDLSVVTIGAFGPSPFSFDGAIADLASYTHLFDSTDRIRKVTSVS